MDSNINQQSIILNFNPNINSDKAYSYEQSANQLLEIKPDTDIALYKAYLQRKAVVIPEDENISINLNSAFNTLALRLTDPPFDNTEISEILTNLTGNLHITMPQGTYTKSEFVNDFSLRVQTEISNQQGATFASSKFQY
jgi:hypothetical protein